VVLARAGFDPDRILDMPEAQVEALLQILAPPTGRPNVSEATDAPRRIVSLRRKPSRK
jgi:hypothetical protein